MFGVVFFCIYAVLFSRADPAPLEANCQSEALAKGVEASHKSTGEEVYKKVCGVCHGVDGLGQTGVFPPVVDTPWVKDELALAQIILRGVAGEIFVKGKRYASAMPSLHKELADQEILGVIAYLQTINGQTSEITLSQIADLRSKVVSLGSISSQVGLDALISEPSGIENQTQDTSFWKGCVNPQ